MLTCLKYHSLNKLRNVFNIGNGIKFKVNLQNKGCIHLSSKRFSYKLAINDNILSKSEFQVNPGFGLLKVAGCIDYTIKSACPEVSIFYSKVNS